MTQRFFYDASYTLRNPINSGVHRVVTRCWEAIKALEEDDESGLMLTRTVCVGRRFVAAKSVGSEPSDSQGTRTFGMSVGLRRGGDGEAISFRSGDKLLLPDAYWACPKVWKAVESARREGAAVTTIVYDLIPIQHPSIYGVGGAALGRSYLENVVRHSDQIVTISQTVAGDVESFVSELDPPRGRPVITSWQLGCDLPNLTRPVREEVRNVFRRRMPDSPYLVVGSFDLRKNHDYVLQCFERLWAQAETMNLRLAFAGTPSPDVEPIVNAVRKHPQYGRKLFLLSGLSDAELAYAYQNARGVIAPSIAEGFCLPIVEALHYQQYVFVSDIPIHREISGGACEFFSLDSVESLMRSITDFEATYEQNTVNSREPVSLQSWQDAAHSLLDKVIGVDRRVLKKGTFSARHASVEHQKRSRYKVLYFTITPLEDDSNGGSICCREHVRQLSQDDRIDLEVVAAADRRHQRGTLAFLAALGVKGKFVPYQDTPGHKNRLGMPWPTRIGPYAHEQDGLWNAHVGETVVERVTVGSPDVIVVDYLHSAAFVRQLYKSPTPVVTITLNREAEFHFDLVKHRYDIGGGVANHLGGMRLGKFESWVHKRSAAVVAIGRYDLPVGRRCRHAAFWFPPLPGEHPKPWQYRGVRHIGFVGNIGHYPNKLAVKWLATKFAPALERIDPEAVIRVVGADEVSVPKQWKRPNVCYLGVADRATVDDIFQSAAFLSHR